jgi:ATP-dependent Lon protease
VTAGSLSFTNTGGTWLAIDGATANQYYFTESTGQLQVVPEPSTCAMFALGLTAMVVTIVRRRRSES